MEEAGGPGVVKNSHCLSEMILPHWAISLDHCPWIGMSPAQQTLAWGGVTLSSAIYSSSC